MSVDSRMWETILVPVMERIGRPATTKEIFSEAHVSRTTEWQIGEALRILSFRALCDHEVRNKKGRIIDYWSVPFTGACMWDEGFATQSIDSPAHIEYRARRWLDDHPEFSRETAADYLKKHTRGIDVDALMGGVSDGS